MPSIDIPSKTGSLSSEIFEISFSGCQLIIDRVIYATGTKIVGATSLEDMVSKLKKPRRVMMLVKAGAAVDSFIDQLVSCI